MTIIPDSVRRQIIEQTLRGTTPQPADPSAVAVPSNADASGPITGNADVKVPVVGNAGKSLLEQTLENRERINKDQSDRIDETRKELIGKTDPSKTEMILKVLLK
jgi:hypothetical protein